MLNFVVEAFPFLYLSVPSSDGGGQWFSQYNDELFPGRQGLYSREKREIFSYFITFGCGGIQA
jgi:hypothetical protein